jgi:hypothetical protein
VTWTSKKHGELVRLFREFLQQERTDETFWLGRGSDKELLNNALLKIEERRPRDARMRHADNLILSNLIIWSDTVERPYKMKPFQAIRWLVEQYYDYAKKEKVIRAFRHLFGAGTTDSIARRMYQKAKERGNVFPSSSFRKAWWNSSGKERRIECDAAALEAAGDLYKLAFEELGIYPEPSVYLSGDEDAYWEWWDDCFIPDHPDNR